MADKGKKSEVGKNKATTVLQLEPVKYQLQLIYLGSKRVKHKKDEYTCRYELCEKSTLAGKAVCTPMANVVPGDKDDADGDLAARSRDGGGTPVDPPSDKQYRIIVLDNHGTRTAENLPLLSDTGPTADPDFNGEKISNPAYYEWASDGKKDWNPDVKPAVPFRVIVKKYVGDTQVDMTDDQFKVVFEVKDPKEELDNTDGPRETFLKEFFEKYNREDKKPDPGDDNALTAFKGLRTSSHGSAGVKAVDVLKAVDYKDPPLVGEVHADVDIIEFSDLKAATADGSMNAKFDLKAVDDAVAKVKVGISDVVFTPWPAGGDNYRFLITLKDGNKDVRETNQNQGDVILLDDKNKPLKRNESKPEESRWYVSPRFTMWRKIEFALIVRANETVDADITWAKITTMYKKAFVEVVKPTNSFGLTRLAWIGLLREQFGSTPNWNFATPGWLLIEPYRPKLFPDWLCTGISEADLDAKLEAFARKAVSLGCAKSGIPDPEADANKKSQEDGGGMCMFLCRAPFADAALGAYIGDRMFWMRIPSGGDGRKWATSTCAHEFGHVRSLRHAHTSRTGISLDGTAIQVVDPRSNCSPKDHDPLEASKCLMGYNRSLDSEPCGFCALSMRFFDRIEIQKVGNYGGKITEKIGAPAMVRWNPTGGGNMAVVTGTTVNMAVGDEDWFLTLGPEFDFTTRSGNNFKGRVNMTWVEDTGCRWTSTAGAHADCSLAREGEVGMVHKVEAKTAGNFHVDYSYGGNSVRVNVRVT